MGEQTALTSKHKGSIDGQLHLTNLEVNYLYLGYAKMIQLQFLPD